MRYSFALVALATLISASPLPANTNVNPQAITSTKCTAKKVYVISIPSYLELSMKTPINKIIELSRATILMLPYSVFAEALQAQLSNAREILQTQLVHRGAHFCR